MLAWSYGIYYILLDWKVGIPAFSFLVSFAYLINNYYLSLNHELQNEFIKIAIGLHVFSWLAQFYGHGVHERRAPALLDNLLQALVLAPFLLHLKLLSSWDIVKI